MVPPVVVTVLESPSTTPRPKDLPWATPHLPAWKVRGAASSHLRDQDHHTYCWYQFLGIQCPVSVFTP